jgi:hypothetical protein
VSEAFSIVILITLVFRSRVPPTIHLQNNEREHFHLVEWFTHHEDMIGGCELHGNA